MLSRIRSKNLHTWLGGYARHLYRTRRARGRAGTKHLLFALCDHFEPQWGEPTVRVADARVEAWTRGYPEVVREFRDADGRHPQHSFFFPGEDYHPGHLEQLTGLVRRGFGEIEVHLHHDGDSRDSLRAQLEATVEAFSSHGNLARDPDGRPRYGFIHGNWCLANSRRDQRWCGVDDEIPLLFDTGCYADFTFPAAPSECQPGIVNQIYWPTGDLSRSRSYECGERARVGELRRDRILMIQGPLGLARRPDRLAVRIENGALDGGDPPTVARAATWTRQGIHIQGRPEWIFVKVYTHGAPEDTAASLLGDDARRFHADLLGCYNDGTAWQTHYVTAREMYNIAWAAMDGQEGNPNEYRDYLLPPPPARQPREV